MKASGRLVLVATAWLAAAPVPADTLLVVRKSDDALDFVDPGSGLRLASVTLGRAPHEVSVSPDGRLAAVSNYGTRDQPGSTLSIVDLEQPKELRRIDLAPHARPHGVAWYAPDRIAVTAEASRHLLIVDPFAGRIDGAIETGQDISHMVVVSRDGLRAYVTNLGSATTSAFDLQARRKLRDVATGDGSEGLALTPDGRELWVTARGDGHIAVVDTATLGVTASLPLPGMPIRVAITPDGLTAFATCAESAEVVAFDITARRERARRSIDLPWAAGAEQRSFSRVVPRGGVAPVGLLPSTKGHSVFVAATLGDSIVQFDAKTLAPLHAIAIDGEPDGLAVTAVMPRALCHACTADDTRE
jgi:YVTN family beta-propeller protein